MQIHICIRRRLRRERSGIQAPVFIYESWNDKVTKGLHLGVGLPRGGPRGSLTRSRPVCIEMLQFVVGLPDRRLSNSSDSNLSEGIRDTAAVRLPPVSFFFFDFDFVFVFERSATPSGKQATTYAPRALMNIQRSFLRTYLYPREDTAIKLTRDFLRAIKPIQRLRTPVPAGPEPLSQPYSSIRRPEFPQPGYMQMLD